MPNAKCGLYDANFTTTSEGNYTIGISAQNPSGTATFSTSFLVQNSYAFDIIRTADSKIDPVNNTNSFNVQIDIGYYVKTYSVKIQEFVPSVFNVTTDAKVQTVGDTKILTWDKDLISNKTSVQYSYSVPLEFPKLYALGPAQITYDNNKTFNEARPWFVANDPESKFNKGLGIVISNAVATTIATSSPTFPAGDRKFIIAAFYWKNGTGAGTTTIRPNNLKLVGPVPGGSTGRIATNVQGLGIGNTAVSNMTTTILIANDTSGTASPTYTLSAMANRTNTVGSGQIMVIDNATQMGSVNQTGTKSLANTKTNIFTWAPGVGYGLQAGYHNLVIAVVHINKTSGAAVTAIAPGNLNLTRAGGGPSVSNAHRLQFAGVVGSAGSDFTQLLILNDTVGGATPKYYVNASATTTNVLSADVKLFILQGAQGTTFNTVNSSDTLIGTRSTAITGPKSGILNDDFPAGNNLIIGAVDINQTSPSATPNINNNAITLLNTTSGTYPAPQMTNSSYTKQFSACTGACATNTQLQYPILFEDRNAHANQKYGFNATATSANAIRASVNAVVIHIRDNFKSLTENVGITDKVERGRTLSDTVSITDKVERGRTLSDTVSITAQVTTLLSRGLSQSLPTETVGITDTIHVFISSKSLPTETVGITDTIHVFISSKSLPTETVGITDQLTKTRFQFLSDTVSITAQLSTYIARNLSLSETVSITDTLGRTPSKSLSDTVDITDQLTPVLIKILPLSDTVGITDTVSAASSFSKSLSETVGITDQLTRTRTLSLSDTVSITDQFTSTRFLSLSDTVSITAQLSTYIARNLSLSETVGITDKIAKVISFNTLSDTVSITDTLSAASSFSKSLSDTVSITAQVTTYLNRILILSDTVGITDQLTKTRFLSLSDTVSITDQVTTLQVSKLSLSDTVSITAQAALPFKTSLSDSVSITDQVTKLRTRLLSLSETVSITDTLSKTPSKSLSETVSITDTLSKTTFKKLSDTVGI